LVELKVDMGSLVKRGDLLARIEVPELEQQRVAMEATMGELDAKRAAVAAVAEADASEAGRASQLARSGAINPKVREEAEQRALGSAAGLAAAEAARRTAQAKLAEIAAMIAYASLRAPFDGVVTARDCELGDLIAAGRAAPLFTVAKVDVMRFRVAVPERTAVAIVPGNPARVVFDALGGAAREGKVARTAGALDPVTRTMLVEIELPNPEGKLLPGLSGHATIQTAASR
jgi:RND family efflux transporter MFP subunit